MQTILVLLVAFVAGIEGILDEFEFHQPIVACTLIGLVTNHLVEGLLWIFTIDCLRVGQYWCGSCTRCMFSECDFIYIDDSWP